MPELNPNVLEVENLAVSFRTEEGRVDAVKGVSFQIPRGKCVALVGESGSGKSVTSFSLLRLIQPPGEITGGRMKLFPANEPALDIGEMDDKDERLYHVRGGLISMIFQEPMTALSPVHTIGNQITEAILLHRTTNREAARRIAVEMLRKVGINQAEERMRQYPHEFSGGMRQRVVIAMALACEPELLIADEPTTALDVTTQSQILELLQDLQEQNGMAIMLITHNLGVIAEMADDVVVMYLGQVAEKGTVDEIFYEPKHPYTRALLQSIPNIYQPSKVELPTISGSIPHPYNRPAGCPFHPRCPDFMPGTCDVAQPETVVSPTGQQVRCFLYTEGAVPIEREKVTAGKDASQ